MSKDIYDNLDTIKQKLSDLQDARDSVTSGVMSVGERERNVSDLMIKTGRFLEIIDSACTAVDDALDELDRLRDENEKLQEQVESLGEQINEYLGGI